MKLLIIILNREEFLNDILSIMAEIGITGATIFDSEGMAHALAYDVPIFAGLRKIVGQEKQHNKTLFALVEEDKILKEFYGILKEEKIDFEDEGMGIMFTVPADYVVK